MPLSVFAADEQSIHPVDTLRWIRLAEAVLADEGIRGDTEVSILFVDEEAISDLNSRFLGKEGPTDVLAFPIDEDPVEGGRSPDSGGTGPGFNPGSDEAPILLGDVVICPSVAAKNAPEHAGTYDDELALLLVHGLLHLLGMDHEENDEAEAMEAKERIHLERHHKTAPGAGQAGSSGSGTATANHQGTGATGAGAGAAGAGAGATGAGETEIPPKPAAGGAPTGAAEEESS